MMEIRELKDASPYIAFAESFLNDPSFSDTALLSIEAISRNIFFTQYDPAKHLLGVFADNDIIGLFSFLILDEDDYMEMLAGLTREAEVYEEILNYLEKEYPGYTADFVISPKNTVLKEKLKDRNAEFDTEQYYMSFSHKVPDVNTDCIELLSERYVDQYIRIHNRDLYWTAERILEAPYKFRSYLALEKGIVVGYIDVTYDHQENEPFDLYVLEEYRNRGFGRELLAKALIDNEPNGMILTVDVDNDPAIHLYESLGFVKKEELNTVTIHWDIK